MTTDEYLARLIEEGTLCDYLTDRFGRADSVDIRRHSEGHSNETIFITWGPRELVLRRPPPGEIAETAHDVLREFRFMSALSETAVPVPRTLLACEDRSVMGCDFFVMERSSGDVIRTDEPPRFSDRPSRRRIGWELVDTLVAIHRVDVGAVGLADVGRPNGFTERQVDRWGRQLQWAFETTLDHRPVDRLETVGRWLERNVPDSPPKTLIHGDYKLDNVMFGPELPPRIVAVFDWELGTVGDPLTDLGWLLSFWHEPTDGSPAIPELYPTLMAEPGYPNRRQLVDRYVRKTGFDFPDHRFYRTLAVYKMAALGEMFFARHLSGNSDDPLYPTMKRRVPLLAERALRIIDGDEPL